MGSDPEGSWLPGSENASGCRGAVALLVPPWDSGARDASESWDPAVTPTPGLPTGFGSWDPEPFADASFVS
jgi:hypothetical protein